jgi:aryl-alcohol dehydrogenase-like predicted oxidoreductase
MPREQGVAVMRAAREAGIDFLDDARYDDDTGTAPIPTGYSEVVFGELFRASGWGREEVVVANKLWWEFWPEQERAGELDASLQRMGLEHLDLAYFREAARGPERGRGRAASRRADRKREAPRVGPAQLAGRPARRGRPAAPTPGRRDARRRPAPVQPRSSLAGRGPRDEPKR